MRTFYCLFLLLVLQVRGISQSEPGLMLRTGFPLYAFSGVMANDAEVASSFYLKKMTESIGMRFQSTIYKDLKNLRSDIFKGDLDFVLMTPPDLMDPQISRLFEPFLVPIRGEDPLEKFLLLVHRDSKYKSLADLQGKNLLMFSGSDSVLEFSWLDRELARQGLPPTGGHFKSVEHPVGASKSVLPVFFKKADACLVSESIFSLICKLNPQVKERLEPLVSSEMLLTTLMAIRRDYPREGREALEKIAVSLDDSVDGKQILMLTKIDRVVKFKPEMMKSALELLNSGVAAPAAPAAAAVVTP